MVWVIRVLTTEWPVLRGRLRTGFIRKIMCDKVFKINRCLSARRRERKYKKRAQKKKMNRIQT